jgi:hypothetical protein
MVSATLLLVTLLACGGGYLLADRRTRQATKTCVGVVSRTVAKVRERWTDKSVGNAYVRRDRFLASIPADQRIAMADPIALLASNRVVAALRRVSPAHLHSVWFFGSRSICDHAMESDLDVAVYCRRGIASSLAMRWTLALLRCRILLDYNVFLQSRLIRISDEQPEEPGPAQADNPLFRAMTGICVYAASQGTTQK